MLIIVVVGRVLDPKGITVNRRRGLLFVNREEYLMQPSDRCALEEALRIAEATSGEVVALPRAPLPDDDVLRQALAMGAHRAVHIVGDDAGEADAAIMTDLLVAAAKRLGEASLLLLGEATLDTGQTQLGARLAEALGWPQVLKSWQTRVVDGRLHAVQRRGGEYVLAEWPMPAVVTLASGALKPRYPNGQRLISVYKDEGAVEKWSATDLLGEAAIQPTVQVLGRDFPAPRERGTRLDGTAEEKGQELATILGRELLAERRA